MIFCNLFQAIIWIDNGLLFIGPIWWVYISVKFKSIYKTSIKKNEFENVICKLAPILSQPECAKKKNMFHSGGACMLW